MAEKSDVFVGGEMVLVEVTPAEDHHGHQHNLGIIVVGVGPSTVTDDRLKVVGETGKQERLLVERFAVVEHGGAPRRLRPPPRGEDRPPPGYTLVHTCFTFAAPHHIHTIILHTFHFIIYPYLPLW